MRRALVFLLSVTPYLLPLSTTACAGRLSEAPASSTAAGAGGASMEALDAVQETGEASGVVARGFHRKAGLVAAPPPPPAPLVPPLPHQAKTSPAAEPSAPPAASEAHGTSMLIYTANLTMAVFQVEQAVANVERIGREAGGYLSLRQDRSITVRVPRDRFDETLRRIEVLGDVLHRNVQAQDVTDEYVDLEVRLKNARAIRDRLQQLLKGASVKDALEIEKELGRVTGEIEAMEGKLKLLKDRIAFATITVAFQPVSTQPVRENTPLPFSWLNGLGLSTLLRTYE